VRIGKRLVLGYVKGKKPWRPIKAYRDDVGDVHVHYSDALDPKDDEDPSPVAPVTDRQSGSPGRVTEGRDASEEALSNQGPSE
jgi:hypothetical protein